jgi:hypothetical protein
MDLDGTMVGIATLFVGSLLTFFGTGRVEEQKEKRIERKRQERYKLYGFRQLRAVQKILDKLRHSFENGGNCQQVVKDSNLLSQVLQPLNNLRNDTTALDDIDMQGKFIDLITDLSMYAFETNTFAAQQQPETTLIADVKDMTTKHIELIELCRRTEELTEALSNGHY